MLKFASVLMEPEQLKPLQLTMVAVSAAHEQRMVNWLLREPALLASVGTWAPPTSRIR